MMSESGFVILELQNGEIIIYEHAETRCDGGSIVVFEMDKKGHYIMVHCYPSSTTIAHMISRDHVDTMLKKAADPKFNPEKLSKPWQIMIEFYLKK